MSDRAEMEKEYNKWQAEREDSVKKEKKTKNPTSYKTEIEDIRVEIAKYLESQGWGVVLVANHGVQKPDPTSFKYQYFMNFLGKQKNLSPEQKTKEGVRQIPNTNGKDRTDIVKSSQLGFEVPEVGKQGEAS